MVSVRIYLNFLTPFQLFRSCAIATQERLVTQQALLGKLQAEAIAQQANLIADRERLKNERLLPSHHRNIHSLNGVKGQSPFVGAQPPHPQKTNL